MQPRATTKRTWPGPCKYVPICIPGFTPDNCHREADDVAAVKDAEAMEKLHKLHDDAGAA